MTNPKYNPGNWRTGYIPYLMGCSPEYFPGFRLNRVLNLKKAIDLPLGARYLKELDDENNQVRYSSFGACLAGFLNTQEEAQLLPFDVMHCGLSKHVRWTIGALKVAEAERLEVDGKLEEARNLILKLLIKSKQVMLRTEDGDLADEMGITETFTGMKL